VTKETIELDTVVYEKEGAIARVILNRPDKANTQSSQLVWDFDTALRKAERDYDVKVVIIKGNGKGFCAGHVMSGEPGTYPETEEAIDRLGSVWRARYQLFVWPVLYLWEFPKPTSAWPAVPCCWSRGLPRGSRRRVPRRSRTSGPPIPAPPSPVHGASPCT
jgi:enoyl-CoA hydratase/carnithine racemase